MRRRNLALVPLAPALLALAAGCQGHGEYTQEHADNSMARMSQLRSVNEFQMAESAFLAGDLEKALTKIDACIAANPEVARSHVLKGRILIEMNVMAEAVASLDRAEQLDQNNVDAQYYQGVISERVRRLDDALARYTRAAELAPANPQFAMAAAETLIDLGQPDRAEAFLMDRDETFRLDAGIQQLLGHMAMMKQDYPRAAERFAQARILAPDDQSTTEDLIHALMQLENHTEADFYLASLLRKTENQGRRDLMHLRVQCLTALDRPVEARDVLLRLVAGEGATDVQAWIALGHTALELKDLGRVREAANRVVAMAPYRPDGFVLRAMWQRRMGDYIGALTSLDDALENAPEDTSIRVMQALVLVDAGRSDLAVEELRIAIAQDPSNEQARQTLQTIYGTIANHPDN